jgi:hypothetical protein
MRKIMERSNFRSAVENYLKSDRAAVGTVGRNNELNIQLLLKVLFILKRLYVQHVETLGNGEAALLHWLTFVEF